MQGWESYSVYAMMRSSFSSLYVLSSCLALAVRSAPCSTLRLTGCACARHHCVYVTLVLSHVYSVTYNFPFIKVRQVDHSIGVDKLGLLYAHVPCRGHVDHRTHVGMIRAEPDGYRNIVRDTCKSKSEHKIRHLRCSDICPIKYDFD